MQSRRARNFSELPVDAVVEQVADGRVRVCEVPVLTVAVLVPFRGLCSKNNTITKL
jgi:hypothetical protein